MMFGVDVATLDREIYNEAEAARILQVPQSTLHWWLEGSVRGGRSYPPVIRAEPTGKRAVTWAEFIEAGLLRQYRRELHVKLAELRRFIEILRDQLGVPYPLACYLPAVGEGARLVVSADLAGPSAGTAGEGAKVILDAQEQAGLRADLSLVAITSNQLIWTPAAEAFLRRVDWDPNDLPAAWRPHEDSSSPVRCSPVTRFGRPAIRGISTEAIVEHLDAGEDEQEVAEQFDLDVADVRWALSFEHSLRQAAAA